MIFTIHNTEYTTAQLSIFPLKNIVKYCFRGFDATE